MMKLRYSPAPDLSIEVEVGTDKAAFEAIVHLSEVFGETECGCCKSKDIKFEVREFSGNKYYKMFCRSCRATFDFGQYKEGNELFAKKWDKENKCYFPNGGWAIWSKDGEQSQSHQHKPQTPVKPLSGGPELKSFREKCGKFLKDNHTLQVWNEFWRVNYPLCPKEERDDLWKEIEDYAAASRWVYDRASKQFAPSVGSSDDSPF